MESFYTLAMVKEAAAALQQRTDVRPTIGLILGSGLSAVADSIEGAVAIPYNQVPNFPCSTVEGHVGRLVIGRLEGHPVIVMQGRSHYYEGYSMDQVTFPVRVMQVLGVKTLIVTNAAGGLNQSYHAGDVMIIRDQINMIGMTGQNPLRGPNFDELGPRFPDMNEAYDRELRTLARKVALEAQVPQHEGVYICLGGPNFESPADIRFLRLIGADSVGMSTVPEVLVARHNKMRVLGLSGITNVLSGEEGGPGPSHEEVLEAGKLLAPRLEALIRGVLRAL